MALAPIAVLADAALLLIYLLGWAVTLGLLYAWNATFHHIFQGIARALSFTVNTHIGYKHTFHLGGWASTIDHAAQELFSDWAVGCEIMVGAFWHALGYIVRETMHAISRSSQATLDLGHYIVHDYVPGRIHADLSPLWRRTNRVAAAAGALAAGLAAIRHETRAQHHAQTGTNHVAKVRADHAAHEAHVVRQAVASQVVGGSIALPRPVTWPSFRRAWNEIKEWQHVTGKRLVALETLLAASGLALAVAKMTGTRVGCWKGRGNIARMLRHVCGVPSWLIDLLVVGTIEAFIASDLCGFTDLLIKQAEAIRPALLELVDVEDALIGCHGTSKPLVFNLPAATLPPLQGVSPLAA